MKLIFNNTVNYSELKKVSKLSLGLYIPKNREYMRKNVYKYNGKYYYKKEPNSFEMVNELIGNLYAKEINLDTVDYKIVDGDNYGIMSEIFYNPLYKYSDGNEMNYEMFASLEKALKGYKINTTKYDKLIDDILKLTALDLKMSQRDRHFKNVIIKESKLGSDFSLSKVFDYGYSYYADDDFYYTSPFVSVRKTEDDLSLFISKNPNIIKYINIIKDIPVTDILDSISKNYGVEFNDDVKKYYKTKDEVNSGLLKRI